MHSNTAGVSYENDETPQLPDEPPGPEEAGHEPELRRTTSYPKAPARTEPLAPAAAKAETLHDVIDETLPDVMDETLPDVMDEAFPDVTDEAFPDVTDDTLPDVMDEMPDMVEEPAGIDALLTAEEPADGPVPEAAEQVTPAGQPAPPPVITPMTSATRHGEGERGARKAGPFGARLGLAGGSGGQPQRQRVLDIIMDARMRYWRERVALMVATLVFFWIIGNWIIGVTLALLAGMVHAVWRSRSIAGIPPGTKLDRAQRITQRKLGRMERAGYRALHARPIPGSEEVIDHLVVGPTGVYAIDSEKWNRKLPIRTRNGKQLWLGPESKKPRLEHAKWEAERASELLTTKLGHDIKVRPALAIYGPHIPWDIAVIRDVDVFNGDRLRRYLRKRSRVREVSKLSRDEIAKICEAADSVFPIAAAPAEPATVLSRGLRPRGKDRLAS